MLRSIGKHARGIRGVSSEENLGTVSKEGTVYVCAAIMLWKTRQTTVTVINNQLNQVYNLDGITMKKPLSVI